VGYPLCAERKIAIEESRIRFPILVRLDVPQPTNRLINREIFEQRQNAYDDNDDPDDLLRPPVNRQHIDQIKNKNNDKEGYEDTY
jgi:hypothetical protein